MKEEFFLFLITLTGGFLFFAFPSFSTTRFQHMLVFSGSYLFSITLIHMIPELFGHSHGGHSHGHDGHSDIGEYLLAGFFLQVFLDWMGGCVAHGHTCSSQKRYSSASALLALGIHATLDGFLLKNAHSGTWLAMILHKIPAAFALAMILQRGGWPRAKVIIALIIFSLAAPLGAWTHTHLDDSGLSKSTLSALNALAVGSLLHIATTMLFEATPNHRFRKAKVVIIMCGAALAVASQHLTEHL